ncbi:checkpoint protein Hus1/Mec3 [Lentinula edodes]|nr:checkpoint protein Hus1/Mec3 [Lentinula edodes]
MRFRAGVENVTTFFRIMQSVEKLQKKCIIKFTEENMHVICNNDANEGGIQVWSQIKIDSIFNNYRIQSNSNNEITVNLTCEALMGALRSVSTSSGTSNSASGSSYETDEVIIKLAKKNDQAVLNFEITGTTRVGRKVRIGHDVKIEVMKPADVVKLSEPMCPEPDIHVLLPSLQKIRTIVERLRSMSDVLAIRASQSGCLQLSINTESVKVDTEWKNCTIPQMMKERASQDDNADDPPPDPEHLFSVLVSVKSFLKFLSSHVVSTTTIACICQNHCLILYVYIGDVADAGGVLTFYIPAIIDDE